jgi:hypothetical protein
MYGKNVRAGRHDQECTPRKSLDVAAETENESRREIYDAPGFRIAHVLEVDDDRNALAVVLTDGDGIAKGSRTHYCDLDIAIRGELVTRGFIVVLNLADVLGMLDGTGPSAGVALLLR